MNFEDYYQEFVDYNNVLPTANFIEPRFVHGREIGSTALYSLQLQDFSIISSSFNTEVVSVHRNSGCFEVLCKCRMFTHMG